MLALSFDLQRVLAFVRQHQPLAAVEGMQAIGLEKDGALRAGVVYEGFNGNNVWMHVAADQGSHWLTRSYLRACFVYPFDQLKVKWVRGYVEASNARSVRFCRHLGFVSEAVLSDAASDGGDVLIFAMRREWCRHV